MKIKDFKPLTDALMGLEVNELEVCGEMVAAKIDDFLEKEGVEAESINIL